MSSQVNSQVNSQMGNPAISVQAAKKGQRHVCVFCGSHSGQDAHYAGAAQVLGRHLVQSGLGLVFGGGKVGLMGVVADAVLEAGGHVIGVIPERLVEQELAHPGVQHLIVTSSMHERKQSMFDHADAFLALPGGMGTLDELCEIMTWSMLGLHDKPIGLLNTASYFDALLRFLEHSEAAGFLRAHHRALLRVEATPQALLARLGLTA